MVAPLNMKTQKALSSVSVLVCVLAPDVDAQDTFCVYVPHSKPF